MKQSLTIRIGILLLALATFSAVQAQTVATGSSDAASTAPQVDRTSAIVQLTLDPLSTAAATKPPQGKKIDFNSSTVKSHRALLMNQRNQFIAWLRNNAPQAKVTGQFDISLNAVSVDLNGTSLSTIQLCPLVKSAEYEGYYYPTAEDPDLGLIQAIEAWQLGGGPTNAGEGVKVAIIDTGIDINHPCFNDAGYPNHQQLGDHRFTNNKVIAAKVFNNRTPTQGYTPEAIQDHGTHVAGTVACDYNTPATLSGVTIPYGVSGVAPRALLGNYNIFPGAVAGARSESIFQALDAAYEDGFDVANMSLGRGAKGSSDLVSAAVDHLDRANMVIAVAAGNSGPGYLTISSPGRAAGALTAGASTVGHFIGLPVTVNGNTYAAAIGEFALVSADLTAPLGVVVENGNLGLACAPLPPGSLNGKIALIFRGACSFSTKIRNAQAAGAVAVLIINNILGDAVGMASDGTPNQPTIPAYMLSFLDGAGIVGLDGVSTTIGATLTYFQTPNSDFMADFTSEGPTPVDFRIKPDVVAPGVNVLSSIPLAYCGGAPCWAFFQGTSMATPHLAGSAAILRWLFPSWSSEQVRSAIINTADQNVLMNVHTGATIEDVNIIGSGRENLLSAAHAAVTLDPVSVSFGAVPSPSGQTQPFNVQVSNVSGSSATFSFAIDPGDSSVAYSVTPAMLSLNAGQSGTLTVIIAAVKGAALGGHQSKLTISMGGSEIAHAAVYTLIK